MDVLIFFLYLISLVIMADSKLKEFPSGKKFLESIENGTVSVLRWRADSDVASDLSKLKKILLITAVIMFVLSYIMMINDYQPNIFFAFIFIINSLMYFSLQWFLDIKKETLKMVGFLVVIVISPWVLHLLGESQGITPSFARIFRGRFGPMLSDNLTEYQLLTELSIILFLGGSIVVGIWIFMFAVPSILLFWFIQILNKASFHLSVLSREKVQLFFVAVNILAPIWFFIGGRQA